MTDNDREWTMANRRRMLAGLASAGAVGIAGCSGDTTTDTPAGEGEMDDTDGTETAMTEPAQGGTLTFSQAKSPIEFDPVVLNDVPSGEVASRIFEALYTYDEGTGVVPELATSEPEVSDDGTVYEMEIEPDATFSNGDPVTAEDVQYSFTAPVDETTENAAEVNMVDTVEVIDEKTVRFNLSFPFGPFIHTLASRSIVPKSVREEDKEAFKTEPVGSGPFLFEEFSEGELTRISANEDYWSEPVPNVDEVVFRPVEEPTTRLTTLQNEENLVIKNVPPKLFNTIQGMDTADVQERSRISYFYLAMNCAEGPTTSKTVREAIDYVFSMDEAVSQFVEPAGVRQYSPIPSSIAETWDFPTDEWEGIRHERDREMADQLFDEAGVSRDYDWTIIVPPDDKREQIGVTVGNGLQEIGFNNVTVQRLDWGAFTDRYVSGSEDDYNLYTLGWSGLPDPNSFTYPLFARADDALGKTNGTYYGANSDRGVEASDKIVQARESPDFEERRQLYIDAITTILEDRAHIPGYNLKATYGVNNRVNDFLPHPVSEFHLATDHNNVSISDN